jgi:hypothetical protein
MRFFNYLLLTMVIIGTGAFVAPYLVPDLVRVEAAELPTIPPPPTPEQAAALKAREKVVKLDKDRKQINQFFLDNPVPTFSFEFEPAEWEYLK